MQAGLVVAALLLVIFVGVTGGITDGLDYYFGSVDEIILDDEISSTLDY